MTTAAKPDDATTNPTKSVEPAATKPAPAKPVEKPVAVPKSAIELRAARRRILQRRFGLFVGVPTLLAIIYYLVLATPQYDSTALLAVESNEGRIADTAGKAPNAGNQRDARLLREALRSPGALAAVDKGGAFRKHYTEQGDWFNRLSSDAGADATLSYFRDKVVVTNEANTNLTSVRVRAFAGETAHEVATHLLAYAKDWVAKQNESSSAARLQQAQDEITRAREHLTTASAALAKLEQPKPTDPASIEHEIAEKRLEAALRSMQEAQLEVGRAQRYLVVVDEPTRADSVAAPRRLWGILTVAVCALVLVSVLSLLGASVREHAKF